MEFASVLDAVTFAVEVQALKLDRNSELPEDQWINFRIGGSGLDDQAEFSCHVETTT